MSVTEVVVLDNVPGGVAFVPVPTPLTRLNYYDGKFLRADDLNLEQRAQRAYVEFSNRAGGPGLVHGFDLSASGGVVSLSPGLAIDHKGRVLLMPDVAKAPISTLLAAAAQTASAGAAATASKGYGFEPCEIAATTPVISPVAGTNLYVVCIAHTEALCGDQEVFGRLCDDSCITATDRPYRLDAIAVMLVPLNFTSQLPSSTSVQLGPLHLRSRVASAYFADEWAAGGSLLSKAGLLSNVWCHGAPPLLGECVRVGVIGWDGTSVTMVDEWTARRERMETPPHWYWQGRMEMRPWPVYLAQILQFQCQLPEALGPSTPVEGGGDPCAGERALLQESTTLIEQLYRELAAGGPVTSGLFSVELVESWKSKVADALAGGGAGSGTTARILVDGGIVELPPAGYLPIDHTSTASLRKQVQDLLGAGVDLRFCAVRRDQIPFELEVGQHMRRISLLQGLDDPANLEKVDIFVPDGEVTAQQAPPSLGFATELALGFVKVDEPLLAISADASMAPQPAGSPPQPAPASAPSELEIPPETPLATAPAGFATADVGPLIEAHVAALADPKRVPITGASRVDVGTDGFTTRMAGIGPVGTAGRALLRAIASLVAEDRDQLMARIEKLKASTDPYDVRLAEELARKLEEMARAGRTENTVRRVVSTDTTGAEVIALWTTLWAASDPFAVGQGRSVAFSVTLDAFVPSTRSSLVELRFYGRAEVSSVMRGHGVDRVKLHLEGSVGGDNVNLSNVDDVGKPVELDVVLGRGTTSAGKQAYALWTGEGAIVGTWSGTPIAFEGAAGEDMSSSILGDALALPSIRIADVKAVQDATLNTAGNTYHDAAILALTMLQGAKLDEPAFLDTAAAQLFPQAPAATIDVQANTDWVLFRRRTWKDCGEGGGVPAPVAPARVETWYVVADSEAQARDYAGALRGGSGDKVPWEHLEMTEFDPGTATLRTSTVVLRHEYGTIPAGERIFFAGYGANGAGPPVGVLRTQAILDALEPAGVLEPNGDVDIVTDPPHLATSAGTEGSVFLITFDPPRPQESTACAEVFNVDVDALGDANDSKDLDAAVANGNADLVADFEAVVESLGIVTFAGDEPDAGAEEVAQKLQDYVDATPDLATTKVFAWVPADWSDAEKEEAGKRAENLMEKLDYQLGDIVFVEGLTGDCPMRFYFVQRRG